MIANHDLSHHLFSEWRINPTHHQSILALLSDVLWIYNQDLIVEVEVEFGLGRNHEGHGSVPSRISSNLLAITILRVDYTRWGNYYDWVWS